MAREKYENHDETLFVYVNKMVHGIKPQNCDRKFLNQKQNFRDQQCSVISQFHVVPECFGVNNNGDSDDWPSKIPLNLLGGHN